MILIKSSLAAICSTWFRLRSEQWHRRGKANEFCLSLSEPTVRFGFLLIDSIITKVHIFKNRKPTRGLLCRLECLPFAGDPTSCFHVYAGKYVLTGVSLIPASCTLLDKWYQ